MMQESKHEGLNNGMMACKPGLSIWDDVIKVLRDRAVWTDGIPWHNSPIWQTGPQVLTEAVEFNTKPRFWPNQV